MFQIKLIRNNHLSMISIFKLNLFIFSLARVIHLVCLRAPLGIGGGGGI